MARKRGKAKKNKVVPSLLIIICALIVAFLGVEENPGSLTNSYLSSDKAYVHFIDVGQGSSALIQSGNKGILIDSGEADYSEVVLSYINSCGVDKLEYVIISHPHSDHAGGMSDIIEKIPVGQILMPELSEINTPTTRLYENLLLTIDDMKIPASIASYGDVYNFEGISFTILGPVEQVKDLNDMSLIVKAKVGAGEFIFLGDGEKQEFGSVLKFNPDLSSDVVALGHHGSKASVHEDFLDKIGASVAVISCGKDNSYGHPHDEALEYVAENSMKLYRTDLEGSIVFQCTDQGFERVN